VHDTSSKNAKLSSATTSFPWRHTNTSKNHGYNAVAEVSCAGSHFLPRMRHSLPTKEVKNVENVKHFRTIHTLRSLPGEGGRCVRSLVQIGSEMWICIRYKLTNKQTFSFIYKITYVLYKYRCTGNCRNISDSQCFNGKHFILKYIAFVGLLLNSAYISFSFLSWVCK